MYGMERYKKEAKSGPIVNVDPVDEPFAKKQKEAVSKGVFTTKNSKAYTNFTKQTSSIQFWLLLVILALYAL